nr:ribbon-helix-helix protein, CopG family [uncultured Rhodopila sp.]
MLHQSASWRCTVQQKAEAAMVAKSDELGERVTASLTREQHRVLRALADKHKVSVAWLIRYAVSQLVEQAETVQLPLDLIRRP